MGRLDVIKAALDAADATAADEHAQVTAHLELLGGQVEALQAAIDQLTADAVTDEDLADLAAQAEELAVTIEGIDSDDVVGGEPEPEPEPEPETPPTGEIFG